MRYFLFQRNLLRFAKIKFIQWNLSTCFQARYLNRYTVREIFRYTYSGQDYCSLIVTKIAFVRLSKTIEIRDKEQYDVSSPRTVFLFFFLQNYDYRHLIISLSLDIFRLMVRGLRRVLLEMQENWSFNF